MRRALWCALCWLPGLAGAADLRQDYAQQWPLQLERADAGAYRIVLDEAIYRGVSSATLGDLQPLDATGNALSAALLAEPARDVVSEHAVPLFALPEDGAASGDDLEVITERDASGAIRRIATRSAARAAASPSQAWLVDASAIRDPLRALHLEWPGAQPVQAQVRVEGSDDLRSWSLLVPSAALMDLHNGRESVRQRRIPLQASARYLRITALSARMPALDAVRVESAGIASGQPWQWLELQGRRVGEAIEYTLPGRFPVQQVDVGGRDVLAAQWSVQSREHADAPWRTRAGPWLAYHVGDAGAQRSPPQQLGAAVRDRAWRLQPRDGMPAVLPTLRLGWRSETLVFLAQGQAPYALAVGSARHARVDAPLQPVLQAMRREHGDDWQPPLARLAAVSQPLAGEAALQPPAVQRDWKAWLLWALLIGGALLVAGLALSLLRTRPTRPTQDE